MSHQTPHNMAVKALHTINIDELAQLHANKNRRYTQLYSGKQSARYFEATLDSVAISHEHLRVGTRIEAAPPDEYIPFAFILPRSGAFKFCGKAGQGSTFVKACGGLWDICAQTQLEFISSVFKREYFYANYEVLTGRAIPQNLLVNQLEPQFRYQTSAFSNGIKTILSHLQHSPEIIQSSEISRLLCSQILKLTVDAIESQQTPVNFKPDPKRIQGAKEVIDYLHEHASELPDMQTLCTVAGISERSLQCGFVEYLGLTPIQYLRVIRLNGARAELASAQPNATRVSDVALNWGFVEFGRFAKDYKELFHELPSRTLYLS